MKRHESLVPLSRFHRSVLFLALVAKKNAPAVKGYPTTPEGKRDYAISFYENRLKDHFRVEEEKLLPAVRGKNGDLDKLTDEIISEHEGLKILFKELVNSQNLETDLDRLGVALEKHIRKEERQFFQLVQQTLTPRELDQLQAIYNNP